MPNHSIPEQKTLINAAKSLVHFAFNNKNIFPLPVFELVSFLTKTSSFELAMLTKHPETNEIYIYLVQRPKGDYWEEMWHMPRVALRPFENMDEAMDRLFQTEVINFLNPSHTDPVLLFEHVTERRNDGRKKPESVDIPEGRGGTLHNLHVLWVDWQQPTEGTFFPLENLPNDTIPHHIDMFKTLREHLNNPNVHLQKQKEALGMA